jgi:CheY-like chemotaxis protein
MRKKLNCVLLIDDNESDNFLHQRVIEKAGIAEHLEILENGKEALDYIATKGTCGTPEDSYCQPELIFLDINMPVVDGWEFLEEFNKREYIQKENTIFVMLTTSLNPSDKTRAEKMAEISCFKYKPLTLDMIDEIMQKHFAGYL